MKNLKEEKVNLQKCSEPSQEVKNIYNAASIGTQPYKTIKNPWGHIWRLQKITQLKNGELNMDRTAMWVKSNRV